MNKMKCYIEEAINVNVTKPEMTTYGEELTFFEKVSVFLRVGVIPLLVPADIYSHHRSLFYFTGISFYYFLRGKGNEIKQFELIIIIFSPQQNIPLVFLQKQLKSEEYILILKNHFQRLSRQQLQSVNLAMSLTITLIDLHVQHLILQAFRVP